MTTALVALGAAVATAVADGVGPATVEQQAVRVDPPRPALLVSDSAWLGIKTYGAIDAVQGFSHVFDLASCRRRVSPSCTNYDDHTPITLADELREYGVRFHTLIVATGYNDGATRFRSDVDTILGLARTYGYERVVWLTLRSNVAYQSPGELGFAAVFEENNATIREIAASGDHPDLVIADWATYARERPQWFAPDGIHLRMAGPWAAADYISRKLAALDGRPCPQPLAPGGAVADPCPDPDGSPPLADVEALYPVYEPGNPTDGFYMEWAGSSSWPAPAWWTS